MTTARQRGRRAFLLLGAGGLVPLAGCGSTAGTPKPSSSSLAPARAGATGVPPTSVGPAASATSSGPSVGATTEPTLPYATAPASAVTTGSGYRIATVRVGGHDSYDRVVVDLAGGTGQPPWDARYVAAFVTQGQGSPVSLPGAGRLLLTVRGLSMPTPSEAIVRGDLALATGSIAGVAVDPWFEGQALVMIGVDRVRPYRVFVLKAPTRVVVDLQR